MNHHTKLVCVTGGPGAGKTALLEVIRRAFCEHVGVLPEAATILFTGGFPRASDDVACARAGQRAIYHVQVELERMMLEQRRAAVVLCDRGTLDGLAYWPGTPEAFLEDVGTTRARELARYAAVLHLKTPSATLGYNNRNPVRIETAAQAATLDRCIADAWAGHPARQFIEIDVDFMQKLARAIELVRSLVPGCCQAHPVELGEQRPPPV